MGAVTTRGVAEDEAGLRLDRWFKRHFPDLAHARLERLLRTGQVRVDGRRVKAGDRVEPGQVVRIPPLTDPALGEAEGGERARPPVSRADAEALQARVIYRDDEVLVIDKPAGLAVQGGTNTSRHLDGLLDALRFEAVARPRLVHRLDKDTSGVLVLARTVFAAGRLTEAFRGRQVRKLYAAVTVGVPEPLGGRIDLPLAKEAGPHGERVAVAGEDGLKATTLYQVLDTVGDQAAYLHLFPLTGRTHQLRVHMAALGTPILGDRKYGGAGAALPGMETMPPLHLHARRLVLPHPRRGMIDVTAPLPPHLTATCTWLGIVPPPADGPFPGDPAGPVSN
jgi:23S rRNA pseudouridine955/2504/2580 synthase